MRGTKQNKSFGCPVCLSAVRKALNELLTLTASLLSWVQFDRANNTASCPNSTPFSLTFPLGVVFPAKSVAAWRRYCRKRQSQSHTTLRRTNMKIPTVMCIVRIGKQSRTTCCSTRQGPHSDRHKTQSHKKGWERTAPSIRFNPS